MSEREECSFWEGVAGDDLAIPFQLIDEDGVPEKIGAGDGMTDIVGEFNNADGTALRVKYSDDDVTLVDSTCGRGIVNVAAASSALLLTSKIKKQTFTIYMVKSGKKKTWLFEAALLLKPRPVPA
jgi:hypothetical protein